MYLRNAWYVWGWSRDVEAGGPPAGRTIIGEPIVVWRDSNGQAHAAEDRCPHRHAALSKGRIERGRLVCMYHGMAFGGDGTCLHMPLTESAPEIRLKTFPVLESDDWMWVWPGDPALADPALVPKAFGISDPARPMRASSMQYDAHYQLLHDNLCDLSHVDFVHETTLRVATGAYWAHSKPRITQLPRAIRFERWFLNADAPTIPGGKADRWVTYDFAVPGIFILHGKTFAPGTAAECEFGAPGAERRPLLQNVEQQAVTPISDRRTAYHYATGLIGDSDEMTQQLAHRMDVVMAAFEEDRQMIEAQQAIWDLTDPDTPRFFAPQDQGPFLMRKLMDRLMREERSLAQQAAMA
jgi:phenylpropionate dioxygenase-like ring-hydroxylating dioxygenase large terminal subunit